MRVTNDRNKSADNIMEESPIGDLRTKKRRDRELYALLITLALPIVFQNLIGNSLVMVDTVMISRLGEEAVAAVGIAGRLQFIYMLISFGFYSGAGVFIAQYNGSGQLKKIRAAMALQLAIGMFVALIFMIVALFFSREYMMIFSRDERVIELGVGYLKYLGLGFVPHGIGYAYVVAMRSIKDPKFPMLVSIVALTVNTALNYVLIFGKLGFPRLGVEGAAIATSLSRVLEMAMMLYTVYWGSRGILMSAPKDLTAIEGDFVKSYIRVSWPIILCETLWGLGTVMYSFAFSKLGTSAFASTQMAQIVNDIMLVASFGLASSVGTILGNKLGEGKRDEAIRYSRRIMKVAITVGLAMGLMLVAVLPWVPRIFGAEGETALNIRRILLARAAANCLITFNWTNITGILRSGGDTVVALVIDVAPMWLVGIPLAIAGATVFGWPVYMVVMMSFVEELIKFVLGISRALKNKWARVLVEEKA